MKCNGVSPVPLCARDTKEGDLARRERDENAQIERRRKGDNTANANREEESDDSAYARNNYGRPRSVASSATDVIRARTRETSSTRAIDSDEEEAAPIADAAPRRHERPRNSLPPPPHDLSFP